MHETNPKQSKLERTIENVVTQAAAALDKALSDSGGGKVVVVVPVTVVKNIEMHDND